MTDDPIAARPPVADAARPAHGAGAASRAMAAELRLPDAALLGNGDTLPIAPPATSPGVAAQWTTRPAAGPWAPEPVMALLPWTREVDYQDLALAELHTTGGWQLLGVSQRGRVHAHDGTHREDAMAMASGERGFVIAAADGAGSSSLSRVASEFACREVVTAVRPHLGVAGASVGTAAPGASIGSALAAAVLAACEQLQRVAAEAGLAPRDFRTTLLAVVCVDDTVTAVQVGDGAVVLLDGSGAVQRLGGGDAGGYSGEVVAFVPELDADSIDARIAHASLDGVACILVLTDGIEDPFYPVERRGAEIARQLYGGVTDAAEGFRAQAAHGPVVGQAQALERLAQWIGFERRGENDDRTLVGAFRMPPAFDG